MAGCRENRFLLLKTFEAVCTCDNIYRAQTSTLRDAYMYLFHAVHSRVTTDTRVIFLDCALGGQRLRMWKVSSGVVLGLVIGMFLSGGQIFF